MIKYQCRGFFLLVIIFFCLVLVPSLHALQVSGFYLNPRYENFSEFATSSPSSERMATTPIECTSFAAFKSAYHDSMINRKTNFSVHLNYTFAWSSITSIVDRARLEIYALDDYLHSSIKGNQWRASGSGSDAVITFTVAYDTTYQQELEITGRVNQILGSILSVGMNDEAKAKAIHDWVVLNVAYDTSYEGHSIYDALFAGSAVCEGYALLMFKMLKTCGIPVRIVSGNGKGEAHAWNLVYLCSAWFHVDATWDDPIPDVPGRLRYNYFNLSDSQIAANHTWDRNYYSAQAASTIYVEGICNNQNPGYAKTYYVPYLYADDYRSSWTGIALANSDQQNCRVQLSYYGENGTLIGRENKEMPAFGQSVFVAKIPAGTVGWIKIESSTNLDGLALIGQGTPPVMFDIDMKKTLHRRFLLSHLAADTSWRSLVMACNPNNTAASLTYSFYNQAGQHIASKNASIPVNGSSVVNLHALFGQSLAGSMVIESNQPITAFMLYDSLTTTWQAGLSALPLD